MDWLREHLGGMVRQYLSTVEVRIDRGAAGGLPSMPDPAKLVEAFRDGGLAALVQTKEQRAVMARMQAAMAVVEGYSEHVMDAIAAEAIPDHEKLRTAMDARRRSRSAPERLVEGLLGLNMKMRQYEQGKVFCDAVVAETGIETLNRVWDSPESLPPHTSSITRCSGSPGWARRPQRPRNAGVAVSLQTAATKGDPERLTASVGPLGRAYDAAGAHTPRAAVGPLRPAV